MGKWIVISGSVILAFSAACVRADIGAGAMPYYATGISGLDIVAGAESIGLPPEHSDHSEPVSMAPFDPPRSACPDDSVDSERQFPHVHVLPADQSSAMLFFSALCGVGVWRLGRSARGLRLASVPDWYHASGPSQVGHVTAISPDFAAPAVISICDLPAAQSVQFLLTRAAPPGLRPQCELTLAAPRGPPLLSL